MWRLWCKAIGEKASSRNKEADLIALIRTALIIFTLLTNSVIVSGVIRHWNDQPAAQVAGK